MKKTNTLIENLIIIFNNKNLLKADTTYGLFDFNTCKQRNLAKSDLSNFSKMFALNKMKFKAKIIKYHDQIYLGEVNIHTKKNGVGTLILKNYSKYEGTWVEDNFSGWGRYIDTEGTMIEGYFVNYLLSGYGIRRTLNDSFYKGEFINNQRVGYGIEENNEQLYEGYFKCDKRNGKGKIIFKLIQESYEGDFKDNTLTGKGTYTWKNGDKFEGDFINGKKEGYGIYTWPEGGSYTGNFVNNLREGKGILKWPNGKIYDGLFSKGKPHGVGILAINDHKYDVEFNEGNLDKKTLKVDNYELKN